MAESCDASNQCIIDAFKNHYTELITAMGPCVMEVARLLYQERLISKETVEAVHDMSMSEQVRRFKVVNAVEAYITTCNSSSKSLEILSILEKHPPLNVVVDNIIQDAGITSGSSRSDAIEDESPAARPKPKNPFTEPPKMSDLLNKVASRALSKWERMGLQLELEQHELNAIQSQNPIECYSRVFDLWKKRTPPPFTWTTVLEALRAPIVEENELAQEIEKWLREKSE